MSLFYKCPMCKKKMRNSGRSAVCENCGYIGNDLKNLAIHTDTGINTNSSVKKRKSDADFADKVSKIVPALGFVVIVGLSIFLNLKGEYSEEVEVKTNQPLDYEPDYEFDKEFDADFDYDEYFGEGDNIDGEVNEYVADECYEGLIKCIFDKSAKEVSQEELDMVRTLDFGLDEAYDEVINYELSDGRKGIYCIENSYFHMENLNKFRKLEVLHANGYELEKSDISELENLTEIWCTNTAKEIAEYVNSDKLVSVGVKSWAFENPVKGIEKLSDVTKLRVDCFALHDDISEIANNKNIKELILVSAHEIESFDFLYDMPQLEVIYIESGELKNIDFVSEMKNLKELTVSDTDYISNIDCLGNCKNTLRKLDLSDICGEFDNYDIVLELTNLEELGLNGGALKGEEAILSDYSELKNLKSLTLQAYDEMQNIKKLKNLEELTLEWGYAECDLSGLNSLKTLNLVHMSLERDEVETMININSIENVSITDTYIWGNAEDFLNMPNLKEIYMKSSTMGFDVSNLEENKSLEAISMYGLSLRELENGEWDYMAEGENEFEIDEESDIFLNYPNLKELTIEN